MKTFLVTGGLGYIGSHASLLLSQSGYKVVILDNLSNCYLEVFTNIQSLSSHPDSLTFQFGDIQDRTLMREIFKRYEINGVMHFAGLKSVPESIEMPILYYRTNA